MSVSSTLRERVRIEQRAVADDGYGGQTVSWAELATVFAQVEPIYTANGEREWAEQRNASAGYRVRMRMRTDVNASMRLVWKTHVLSIHSIHEQGELLSILANEENI